MRWRRYGVAIGALMIGAPTLGRAQSAPVAAPRDSLNPSSACWRFGFGAWAPPLDWSGAGHTGEARSMADRVRRIRDSVFVKDSIATNSNAMYWDRTEQGLVLFLFPHWWPVGVEVLFDAVAPGAAEMAGQATAMVADASQAPSRARVRAWQVPCGAGQ
jgi:hypothetical protein